MPEFIKTLVALAMSVSALFTHGGKPETTPPVNTSEVSIHGRLVSEAAQALEQTNQSEGQNEAQTQEVQTQGEGANPDTTRVAAYNLSPDKEMPTLIPQVAVENSVALDALPVEGNTVEATEIDTDVQTIDESADFGQGIAGSQPDSAKANGHAFGQTISEGAKDNSRRP